MSGCCSAWVPVCAWWQQDAKIGIVYVGLVDYINGKLKLSINANSDDIFDQIKPGVLLWCTLPR